MDKYYSIFCICSLIFSNSALTSTTFLDIIISLKESPEFNLHIWNGYVETIVDPPIFTDKDWVGFTRDYQEFTGAWDDKTEIKEGKL